MATRIWNTSVLGAESILVEGVAATGSTAPATDAWTVNSTATAAHTGTKTLDAGSTVVYNGSGFLDDVTVNNTLATSKTTVNGGAGADTITITAGKATINGGAGIDTINLAAGVATTAIYDSVDKVITAATAQLTVDNSAGTTAVNWNAGTPTTIYAAGTAVNAEYVKLIGSTAADTITGGAAAITLDGGAGADTLTSGAGATTFIYDAADAIVNGAAGDAILTAAADTAGISLHMSSSVYTSIETVIGGSGNDDIRGMAGVTSIRGGAGNDYIWAGANATATAIDGGAGTDEIWVGLGEAGKSITSAAAEGASDVVHLYNVSAYDLSFATGANGTITFNSTGDTLVMTGAGSNANATRHFTSSEGWSFDVVFGNAAGTLNGTAGVIDNLIAGAAGSILNGKGGNDNLYGIAGGTTYVFNQGDTIYNAAASADTITAASSTAGVAMYLDSTVSVANAATSWSLVGSNYNDEIRGQSSSLALTQNISGGVGNDYIWGGAGALNVANMTGGAGNDVYYYGLDQGADVITAGTTDLTGNSKDQLNLYNVSLDAVSGAIAGNNLVLNVVGSTSNGTLTLTDWNVAGGMNKLTDVVISGTAYTLSVDSSNNAVFTAK
ncbi:calcium-binding protein [uncultured Anaeromusa sp.]|uniref:beta strand repeat-containing protein n=1 Tax=uncultured Anaeromusa sp. TaxID=673273 RepID=UPI0029C94BAD|nr:calcium-binding protein [uncultured Anaeromusa sp.]